MKSHASINRIYRLVWNTALQLWVAVAENARGCSKGGSGRSSVVFGTLEGRAGESGHAATGFRLHARCRAAMILLLALSTANLQVHAADALNATVVAGSGQVATAGNVTTINQGSQNLAIDWTSLSTRANEALVFNQPHASAIALNRIIGASPSELLGSLTANGQVFILNPNGVLFGAGSQVNVGGLLASTLSLSNADFMAGKYTFSGTGAGSVVNQGTLNAAPGGYLALLAPEVRNEGVMTASLGTALLAAGNKVTLNLDNGSLLGYSIDQGAINALAENKQLIQANGGQVLLSARAMDSLTTATVNNTGIIEAKTIQNKAGRILLLGDMETGTVNIGGTLDASAPSGGDGGFIETSAANFKILPGSKVTTLAPQGKTGTWLLDPAAVTIVGGSGTTDTNTFYEDYLEAATTNVVIEADNAITASGTFGNSDVQMRSGLDLTLRTIGTSGAGIDLTGSTHGAGLNFRTSGGGSVSMSTAAASQAIKTSQVTVTDGGSITLNSAGMLDISNTALQTAGGAISLTGAGTGLDDGVKISKGTVNAGTGALTIAGSTTTGSFGVNIENSLGTSTLTGGAINITGSTTAGSYGVRVDRSSITASNGLTLDSATGNSRMYLQGATLDAAGGNILVKSKGTSTAGPDFFQSMLIEDVSGTRSKIRNTGTGNITIDAQLTSHASSTGSPTALLVRNSDITTSAGTISLTGATGTSGYVEGTSGVRLESGAKVAGAGNISITGTAGATAHIDSFGVNLLTGSEVTSSGGNVAITGTYNNPASLSGTGVRVAGKVQSGPSGGITLTGNATVGNASGTGVVIDTGANLIAGTGGLTVTGTTSSATTATFITAVDMSGGIMTAPGPINLTGIISAPSAVNARALYLGRGSISTTGAGTISLNGSGVPPPAPAANYDVQLTNDFTATSAGGQISLVGDRVDISSIAPAINAGVGRVVIAPTSSNREIILGGLGGSNDQMALSLMSSELNRITAGTLVIGANTNTAGISIIGAIAPTNVSTLSLINKSSGSPGISQTAGITIANLNADASSVNLTNAANQIGQISGHSYTGNFAVSSSSALAVGTVAGTTGINSGSNTTQLIAGGALSQTQAIVANNLQATSTGGMTLGNTGNQIASFDNLTNSTSGDIVLRNTAGTASFSGTLTSAGRIDIGNTGAVTLGAGSLSGASNASGTTAGTAAVSVVATGGISASGAAPHISNSAGGTVYLEAGNGSIGASAGSAVGVSATGPVTAVATGAGSQVNLALVSGGTLESISAAGNVNVLATTGNLAVKTVSGTGVTLSASAGAITDANGAANNITAVTLNATAANGITLGTNVTGLQTLATTGAAGDISIAAANAINTSNFGITTNAGAAQTVSLNSSSGITVDSAFGNAQDNFKLIATGGNLNVNAALQANQLTLSTTGTSAQTAAITAAGLELLGTGTHTLNNTGNAVTTLAGNTGNVDYAQAGALSIGTVNTAGLTASGKVLVRTTGAASDITLNNGITSGSAANDSLVLAAGRNFVNNAGANPLNPGAGRFLVYATNPAANTLGAMASTGNAFGRTYAANAPADASMTSLTGNRFVYSVVPTLNVSGDNQSKAFGGADPALTYTVGSGLVTGDTAATALGGALSAPTGAATTGPTHLITQGTLASSLGYNVAYTNGTLTVTGAPAPAPASAATSLGVGSVLGDAYVSALSTIAGTDEPLGGSTGSKLAGSGDDPRSAALNEAAADDGE